MRTNLSHALPLVVLSGVITLAPAWATAPPAEASPPGENQPPRRPRARITISEQTTVILGPVRKDGYVDYVAALNQRCSAGVTPENNAAVLFCKAFGPSGIHKKTRRRFFEMLGIEPLPEQGDYILEFSSYVQRLAETRRAGGEKVEDDEYKQKLHDDFNRIMKRPWSKKEFPEMAGWLEENAQPLQLVVEGTRRPRYYTPMLAPTDEGESGMLIGVLLPILQQTREAARLLSARAMLRLHDGQAEAAWQDLLACHRLARLTAQDPTLVGALVGIAIDGIACAGDARLIHHGNLTAEQTAKMLADLRSLPPLPTMAERIDTAERYMYLDAVSTLARGRTDLFEAAGVGAGPEASWVFKLVGSLLIDWDQVLRTGNSWYDRIVEALNKPTHAERVEAMKVLEDELNEIAAEVKDPKRLAGSFFQGHSPRYTASCHLANALAALFLPAVAAARKAEDRAATQARLTELAFALAGYRADNGAYPDTLAGLAPEYIPKVPRDLFTGGDFRYQPQGQGFLLYSLGPNMKDNGARVYYLDTDEAAEGEDTSQWDDYRLRIPPDAG